LKKAIFRSNLSEEFNERTENEQQDAGAYLDFILGYILNLTRAEKTTKSAFYEISEKIDQATYVMQVPMVEKIGDFQSLVNNAYSGKLEKENFRGHDSYHNITKIMGKPSDMIAVQLKRGATSDDMFLNPDNKRRVAAVNQKLISIPDCKVDFSLAYDNPEGEHVYQVSSFIHRLGADGSAGHYVTYTRKNKQWYCCDDDRVTRTDDAVAMRVMERSHFFFFEKVK